MGCTVRATACAVRTAAGRTDARWRAPAAVVCPWAMHERRTTAQTSKLTRSGLDRRGVCFSRFGAPRPRCCRLWPHPMSTIALSAVFWPHPGRNTSWAIASTERSARQGVIVTCRARYPPAQPLRAAAAPLSNTMVFDEVTSYLCAILCVSCIMYAISRLLAEPANRMAPLRPVVARSAAGMVENPMLWWK